jgi:hypothetical protein
MRANVISRSENRAPKPASKRDQVLMTNGRDRLNQDAIQRVLRKEHALCDDIVGDVERLREVSLEVCERQVPMLAHVAAPQVDIQLHAPSEDGGHDCTDASAWARRQVSAINEHDVSAGLDRRSSW